MYPEKPEPYRLHLVDKDVSAFGHPIFNWQIKQAAEPVLVFQFREVSHDHWKGTSTVWPRCGRLCARAISTPPSPRPLAGLPRRPFGWRAERERNARVETDRMVISTSFKTTPPGRGACGPTRAETRSKMRRRWDGLMVLHMGREGMIPSSRLTRRQTLLQPTCLRQQSRITPRRQR